MKRLKECIKLFFVCTWWIWLIVIIFLINYKIAASDLPVWFKYWLLK